MDRKNQQRHNLHLQKIFDKYHPAAEMRWEQIKILKKVEQLKNLFEIGSIT